MQNIPGKDTFYGAEIDLRQRVSCNLFLLCPNNSGSTFLAKAIATSPEVWSLPREGQHALGFSGPITQNENGLTWASSQDSLDEITDPKAFNWAQNEKTWYFQAQACSPAAKVFFTKTPPFLAYAEMLKRHFRNPRFLIMVRNPYAVIEAILRRNKTIVSNQSQLLATAVQHTVACLQMQRRNQKSYNKISTFFTYEEMCAKPETVEQKIKTLVPEIKNLRLDQRLAVKGQYDAWLRNMNDEQIGRLSAMQLQAISDRLLPHAALLGQFGYDLIR